MNKFFFTLALSISLIGSSINPATLFAQHSDVLVTNVGGQVAIGAASDIGNPDESFDLETIVFETIMVPGFEPPTPADYESEEPGFFALNGTSDAAELAALGASALPGNAGVSVSASSFSIGGATSTLFYWDGQGSVNFTPAPAGTTFSYSPATNFETTGPNGDMDGHPVYQLDASSGLPADGVYLVSPTVDVDGLATSDPFYSVLLADALIVDEDDEEAVEEALEALEEGLTTDAVVDFGGGVTKEFAFYEEAVEFVEETFAIPEPSTALLSLAAFGMLLAGRKQRS
ncbi:PEP-CTERM sorting domain-containing protein [Adhaeretor mobilis]|uniref:PEP-CTERM protein-sorting domain-containing protein n=1 Tax=Adhaeretor mobilis TaxID=1930276 RepID=A0A517MV20_9BACT|nr:PEP-CTERM sorting domain-containing protein [Adhaeretor mobilis]QDS98733.1 hypothetical protein HG15A2_20160 [Adhaeretor mobilis]